MKKVNFLIDTCNVKYLLLGTYSVLTPLKLAIKQWQLKKWLKRESHSI